MIRPSRCVYASFALFAATLPSLSVAYEQSLAVESQSPVTARLASESAKLRPLMTTDAGRAFLDAAKDLPDPGPRVIHRSEDRKRVVSDREFRKLPEADRAGLVARTCDPEFYYYTGYGSPLISSRGFDLAAAAAGWSSFKGRRILDFGYGSIGQGRILAALGADYTGIEVEPMFPAMYAEPGDTGPIGRAGGRLTLLHGRWPADEEVTSAAGDGYDLFISKNTLKRGYIHPARYVDPKFLVKLGVNDETFVTHVHRALKPGGYLVVYNISPAQTPKDGDKPYLPHADGQCPFKRELLEKVGFEVIEFDKVDDDAARDIWMALGLNDGKLREEVAKDLFAWVTIARRKP
ncbi:MAG: hypothetical protein ACK4WH_02805 [Phycisphaerales bacterium]